MKKGHFLFTIFLVMVLIPFVYAEPVRIEDTGSFGMPMYEIISDYGYFIKNDGEGNLVDNAEFKQNTFNNTFEYQIPLASNSYFDPMPGANDHYTQAGRSIPTVRSGVNGTYQYLAHYIALNRVAGPIYGEKEYLTEDAITKQMNGSNHEIKLKYYKLSGDDYVDIFVDLLIDGKLIISNIGIKTYQPSEFVNITGSDIKEDLNDIFTILKGTDNKDYLVLKMVNFELYGYGFLLFDNDKMLGLWSSSLGASIDSLTGTHAEDYKLGNKYIPLKFDNNRIRLLYSYDSTASSTASLMEIAITVNEGHLYAEQLYEHVATTSGTFTDYPAPVIYNNMEISPYDLLTTSQKRVIDNLKTIDDYEAIEPNLLNPDSQCAGKNPFITKIKSSNGFSTSFAFPANIENGIPVTRSENDVSPFESGKKGDQNYIDLYATSFMKIEETKTPKGLEKVSAVLPITVGFRYMPNGDGSLTLVASTFESYNILLKYDPTINYDNLEDVFNKIDDSYVIGYGCDYNIHVFNYNCNTGDEDTSVSCQAYPVIVDETSEEDLSRKLEIESLVNGKGKVSVKKNSEVTITVKLTNTAKTPSYENKITSYVPKGLTFVEGSALKGGQFNSEEGTVTWDLGYLDAESVELFTYRVVVPATAKDDEVYKSTATVTNADFDTPIVSDEAKVDVGGNMVNPKTGTFSDLILLILLVASLGVLVIVSQRKRLQDLA